MKRILALALAMAALVTSSKVSAQESVALPAPELSLRVIDKAQFCSRLSTVFTNYGRLSGYDKVQTALLATGAAAGVMQEFREGRATDFINTAALAAYSRVPNRAPANNYLALAGVVGEAMGINGNVTLALSAAELRFIPFAQRGMDMIVISTNAAGMTPERATKVAEVARSMNIKIHIVWVGSTPAQPSSVAEAQALAWIAASTGGAFANLGGDTDPCAAIY